MRRRSAVRVLLVGTDLAPVVEGAGALESLLWGWGGGLAAAGHEVHLVSVGCGPGGVAPPGVTAQQVEGVAGVGRLAVEVGADAVVLNNRPEWGRAVGAPVLHLFHNWPDAWGVADGYASLGRAGAAAVSGALASVVARATDRVGGREASVRVVPPFVAAAFLGGTPAPEPGLVLSPNRLLVKKGVRELVAAAPLLRGRRIAFTDHLSPWAEPTAEHLALRAAVSAAPSCALIPPPRGPVAMAALYATAEVVVVPSVRPEGLGMAAVEAQACGVPVVSSGLGGLAEATLLSDLIADPTQPAELAAAIERAATLGPDQRAALRSAAVARYSLAASLGALEAALGEARPP